MVLAPAVAASRSLQFVPPLIFLAVSAPYFLTRPFFDDELMTLQMASFSDPARIWTIASSWDIHPPLHYIYAWFFLRLPVSTEAAAKASGVMASATALIVLWRILVARFRWNDRAATIACAFAAIHPSFVLNGSAFRWYPLFTALALVVVDRALSWHERRSWRRGLALGCAAVAAFLTSYLTFVLLLGLAIWLGIATIRERRALGKWPDGLGTIIGGASLLFVAAALYLGLNQAHLRSPNVPPINALDAKSVLYATFTVVVGQSILPWEWFWGSAAAVSAIGIALLALRSRGDREKGPNAVGLAATFLSATIIAAIATGFDRGRCLLVVSLVLAPCLVQVARGSWRRSLIAVPLVVTWIVGDANVILRRSLHKSGLQEPVEEVATRVREETAHEPTLVLLAHPVLTYYLGAQSRDGERPALCSFFSYRVLGGVRGSCPADITSFARVLLVDNRLGSLGPLAQDYKRLVTSMETWARGNTKTVARFGHDQAWAEKNRWRADAEMRPWRFELVEFRGTAPPPEDEIRRFYGPIHKRE